MTEDKQETKKCIGCETLSAETRVTVCDYCFRACCLQGYFMCDAAVWAGTVEKTVGELREMAKNHPDGDGESPEYWHIDPNTGVSVHAVNYPTVQD